MLITGGGVGYTNASNLSVTISGGGGANAAATGIISGGQVVQAVMTNPGSGYTNASNITVTITGGGGSNATAKAIINLDDNTGFNPLVVEYGLLLVVMFIIVVQAHIQTLLAFLQVLFP